MEKQPEAILEKHFDAVLVSPAPALRILRLHTPAYSGFGPPAQRPQTF